MDMRGSHRRSKTDEISCRRLLLRRLNQLLPWKPLLELRAHAESERVRTCKPANAAEQALLPLASIHLEVVRRLQGHRVGAAEVPQRAEEVSIVLRLKTGHCCIISGGIVAGVDS